MSALDEQSANVASAALRQARYWEPQIEVDRRPDGTIYIRQLGELPPPPQRISDRLRHWAETTPDHTFIADRGPDGEWRKLSYRETLERARRLGQKLVELGLSTERPVLILSGNDIEHAQLALACILVGVPYSALSEAYSLVSSDFSKLRDIKGLLNPGLVFAADGEIFSRALDTVFGDTTVVVTHRPPARGALIFSDLLATEPGPEADAAAAAVGPDTIAKWLFTSGSTGSPKAVINTNRMIAANQMMVRDCYAFVQDEPPVILDWTPWNHTAGGNKVFFLVMFNGGTLYIDDGRPTPAGIGKTLRNLAEIAPTWFFNVPRGYEEMVHAFDRDHALRDTFFSRVKMLMYAGAGMGQHTWEALQRQSVESTGERVLIASGLGATETAPFSLMCTIEAERAGNVGIPAKGITLKLVPVGDKLEARLKGPNITPGYWKQPELTAKAFDDEGFYNLGDALRFADPEDVSRGFYFDGRTAENFKLRTGTWVNVGRLRTTFIDHFDGLVKDVAVTGLNEEFLGGLVFPDLRMARELAGDHALDGEELMAHPAVRAAYAEKLRSLARTSTGSSTLIRRIILLSRPADIDRGEVTDKGSINQRQTLSNRAEEVAEIYLGGPRVISIED